MLKRMVIKAAAKQRIAAAGLVIIFITLFFLVAANAADFVLNARIGLDADKLNDLRRDPAAFYGYIEEKLSGIKNPLAVSVIIIVYTFFVNVLSVGYSSVCLMASRGKKVGFSNLFDAFPRFFKATLIKLIQGLLTGLGFLLFLIPGVILACAFSMTDYVFYDRPDLSVFGVLRESARMTRGKKLEIFAFFLSFIGWYFLDRITVISKIWTKPYFTVSLALFYDHECLENGENTVL
ncbi:MAG: DUF975 family protein [Clostridia bacterium]|nr:DUF975 family protein [Clostridia bacterium]